MLLPGRHASYFNSRLDSFRTRVPEEKGIEGRVRHNRQESLDELHVRLMETDTAL